MFQTPLSGRAKLTLLACVLCCGVIALGAFTRLVDAGLGCPDWPGCYGHVMWPESAEEIATAQQLHPDAPVDTDKTWPEMVHRYFASSLGFVIVVLGLMAWRQRRDSLPIKLPLLLIGLVILQGLFGMWTVTLKHWPQVVTTHLLGGFTTLMLLWIMFLRLYKHENNIRAMVVPALKPLKVLAVLSFVAVFLQISLGGWTSSNYAALACIDFPTCHGTFLPATDFSQGFNFTQQVGPNYLGGLMDNEARTAIHYSHRLGAIVVSGLLLLLIAGLLKTKQRLLRNLAVVTAAILVLQVALGITNIIAALPLSVAVAHNGVGALLLLAVATINYMLFTMVKQTASNNVSGEAS